MKHTIVAQGEKVSENAITLGLRISRLEGSAAAFFGEKKEKKENIEKKKENEKEKKEEKIK